MKDSIEKLRARFLADVEALRPKLHRYCARMTGSVLDGEDLVQETLMQAFFQLPTLEDQGAMKAWIFRIAHRRCLAFLRRPRRELPMSEESAEQPESAHSSATADPVEQQQALSYALELLVHQLTPKQRAAVLLKDALDCSLTEVAEILGCSLGAAKDALHRGRRKLHALNTSARSPAPEPSQLMRAYLDAFNTRAWEPLRKLIRSDARLEVVGYGESEMRDGYTNNYAALPWTWRLAWGRVDGEPMVIHLRLQDGVFTPYSALRISFQDGRVCRITDYVHVEYLLAHSRVTLSEHQEVDSPIRQR